MRCDSFMEEMHTATQGLVRSRTSGSRVGRSWWCQLGQVKGQQVVRSSSVIGRSWNFVRWQGQQRSRADWQCLVTTFVTDFVRKTRRTCCSPLTHLMDRNVYIIIIITITIALLINVFVISGNSIYSVITVFSLFRCSRRRWRHCLLQRQAYDILRTQFTTKP